MFISADQILMHMIGDYVLQSNWMATTKTRSTIAAAVHALTYSLPFILFPMLPVFRIPALGLPGLALLIVTHFFIDRWRLARYIVWLKNWLGPNRPWSECQSTGYPPDTPPFLAVWLLIIVDNLMHICINGIAYKL